MINKRYKNDKTFLVFIVLSVKLRINSAKGVNLSVNGEKRHNGAPFDKLRVRHKGIMAQGIDMYRKNFSLGQIVYKFVDGLVI